MGAFAELMTTEGSIPAPNLIIGLFLGDVKGIFPGT
jgi:hypothetical protein